MEKNDLLNHARFSLNHPHVFHKIIPEKILVFVEKNKGVFSCNPQIHGATKYLFFHCKLFMQKILHVLDLITFTVSVGETKLEFQACPINISGSSLQLIHYFYSYGALFLVPSQISLKKKEFLFTISDFLFLTERRQKGSAFAENIRIKLGTTSLNYNLLCQISRHPQLIMF